MTQLEEGFDGHPWIIHSRTLRQHFADVADSKCLLWVNPAQRDPFGTDSIACNRKRRVPIVHPRFDLRFAPYLVQLDLTNTADTDLFEVTVQLAWEAWNEESLKRRRGQPIAGWVATNGTPAALARHWARYTHVHLHDGFTKLLRFHDPGVREWLWQTLTKDQQRQLLGPARSLSAIDRHQQLMHHVVSPNLQGRRDTSRESEAQVKRLTLTQKQWNYVEDFAIVHAAWTECRFKTDQGKEALHPNWQTEIFPALVDATEHGVTDHQDRELFAVHVLKMGAVVSSHRKMQEIWTQTRNGIPYGRALERALELANVNLPQYLADA